VLSIRETIEICSLDPFCVLVFCTLVTFLTCLLFVNPLLHVWGYCPGNVILNQVCIRNVTKMARKVTGNIGPVQDFIYKEAILCIPYEILYLSIILCLSVHVWVCVNACVCLASCTATSSISISANHMLYHITFSCIFWPQRSSD
jgi:hypothetical protein